MVRRVLEVVAPGVYVWRGDDTAEHPNASAVIDEDGITVVDALLSPADASEFAAALTDLGVPIRRLVLTSSHVDRVGGSAAFPLAAVYGRRQTEVLLEQPPNIEGYRALYPSHAAEFDDEFVTREVTHVVDAAVQLTPAVALIPSSGQSLENVAAVAAGAGVCLGGAMLSFGLTPLAFDGDPARWADSLDELASFGPIFVPGNGPVGGADELANLAGYLRACVAAAGDPNRIGPGPWDDWAGRDRDEINVERAALLINGDRSVPESMLRRLGRI